MLVAAKVRGAACATSVQRLTTNTAAWSVNNSAIHSRYTTAQQRDDELTSERATTPPQHHHVDSMSNRIRSTEWCTAREYRMVHCACAVSVCTCSAMIAVTVHALSCGGAYLGPLQYSFPLTPSSKSARVRRRPNRIKSYRIEGPRAPTRVAYSSATLRRAV